MGVEDEGEGNPTRLGAARAVFIPFSHVSNSGASGDLLSESLGLRRVAKAEGSEPSGDVEPRSRQLSVEDQFARMVEARKIIEPPFDLDNLSLIPEESSIMGQCIDAMETNIDGYGWGLEYAGIKGQEELPEVLDEKNRVTDLLETINPRESFPSLRKKLRRDYESSGNGYLEIIRSLDGRIKWIEHLVSATMRLGPLDKEPQKITIRVLGSSGRIIEKEGFVLFRRFLQIVDRKKVWFKEFGDRRIVRASDGKNADESLPIEERANEVIHYRQYSSRSPYGIPRYIGNLPSIRGGRMSEIVDVRYFERNCIPQMVVTVSGGSLTKESFQQLEKTLTESGGLKNFWGVLVLEGTPQGGGVDEKGTVRIEMKSLLGDRLSDAQFLKYKEACIRNIRSAWRLPPLHLGRSEEYSYAVAQAARVTAEEQVFIPERRAFDELVNLQIFRDMEIKYWKFFSKGPSISDMKTYMQAVESFNTVGAMTPNTAIMLANELLDVDMQKVEQPWGDLPFSIVERLAEQGRLKGLEGVVEPGGGLDGLVQTLHRQIEGNGEDKAPDGADGITARACSESGDDRSSVLRELVRKLDVLIRRARENDRNAA